MDVAAPKSMRTFKSDPALSPGDKEFVESMASQSDCPMTGQFAREALAKDDLEKGIAWFIEIYWLRGVEKDLSIGSGPYWEAMAETNANAYLVEGEVEDALTQAKDMPLGLERDKLLNEIKSRVEDSIVVNEKARRLGKEQLINMAPCVQKFQEGIDYGKTHPESLLWREVVAEAEKDFAHQEEFVKNFHIMMSMYDEFDVLFADLNRQVDAALSETR